MSAEPVETLVERVREALVNYGTWRMQKPRREKALAALTELEKRLTQMERERNEYHENNELLRERAEAAERERDKKANLWIQATEALGRENTRAEAAEARVAALEAQVRSLGGEP